MILIILAIWLGASIIATLAWACFWGPIKKWECEHGGEE